MTIMGQPPLLFVIYMLASAIITYVFVYGFAITLRLLGEVGAALLAWVFRDREKTR